jgi:nucleoside phosphorylase
MATGTQPSKETLTRRVYITVEIQDVSDLSSTQSRPLIRHPSEVKEIEEDSEPDQQHYVVILVATGDEYNAVVKHLDPPIVQCEQDYEKGRFRINAESREIVIGQTGIGNVLAGIETTVARQLFRPDLILFLGTAGGVKFKDVKLGDVVIGDYVYDYEYGVYTASGEKSDEFSTRPRTTESDRHVIKAANHCVRQDKWKDRIKEEIYDNNPAVHVGAIASGEKLFKSTFSEAYEIIRKSGFLAVEQEGYGFLVTARRDTNIRATPATVVRGISDLIAGKDEAEEKGSKQLALTNASAFAFELIANLSQEI